MMKAKPKLYVFSNNYPYGPGEVFLENEIPYLNSYFDVTVIPVRRIWSSSRNLTKRKMPTGVNLLHVKCRFNLITLLKLLPHTKWRNYSVFRLSNYIEGLKEFLKVVCIVSSVSSCREIDKSKLAYSYWKAETAAGLSYLRMNNKLAGLVCRAHRYDLYHEQTPLSIKVLDGLVAKNCDLVCPISFNGAMYLNKFGYHENRIQVHRLGVPSGIVKREICSKGIYQIVSCSRITKIKRVDLIANALALIENLDIKWVHFGGGEEYDNLKEACKLLPRNIEWDIRGATPNLSILEFYKKNDIDLFINASSSEGVPVSIMEAFAHSIPCIATDCGGTSELVNSSNGQLLPINVSVNTLSLAIRCNLTSESRNSKRNCAYQTWSKLCNADKCYLTFCETLFKYSM